VTKKDDEELVNEICHTGIDALLEIYTSRPEAEALLRHLSRRISVLVSDALRDEQFRQERSKPRGQ
jgi:hypothetical protein